MHELLSTHYSFDDVTIMLDTDPSGVQPTGANIKVPTSNNIFLQG